MAWTASLGLGVGLGGAWALSRVATSLLHRVTAHDAVAFVAVPRILIVPVTLATLVPARRALRVNPAEVMRAELVPSPRLTDSSRDR